MNGINKKYNIEIEVLTPLSIGAGAEKDWVRGVDFVVDNQKLYKLNLKKMVNAGLRPEELSNFFANKNESGLKSKLAGKLKDMSDAIIPCPIESDNDIKAFVKNQMNGKPVLVGSSLKGAIRSVLFEYLGGTSKNGQEVFGSSTDGDEIMRFIKISDAEFDETSLVNTKIFNLQKKSAWQGGWKHGQNETSSNYKATGFNTLYESLMPGQIGVASLMIAEKTFSNFNPKAYYQKKIIELEDKIIKEFREEKREKLRKEKASVEKLLTTVEPKEKSLKNSFLLELINNHTKNYLQKEKSFFEKYATDRTDEIVQSIDKLLKQIPQDNSYCILKMSAGAGFHSITGDWQFDDFSNGTFDRKRNREGKVLPKSRKIACCGDSLSLMGFVKLKPISDEEVEKRKQEIVRREQERLAEIQRQKEAEEREKREAEERQARYQSLIAEAKELESEEKYEEALAKANEAKELLHNGREHEYWISQIQYKVDAINAKREVEELARKDAEARVTANKIPLTDKISNASKIPTLCGNVKTWLKYDNKFSDEDYEAFKFKLIEIYHAMKSKEQKEFQNFAKWKQVSEIVGEETARQWFDEIIKQQ